MHTVAASIANDPERTHGQPRSPHWPVVRDAHLKEQPCCQVCGASDNLNVHHIQPFHLHPELELTDSNLITLCEGSTNCHFLFGHLRNSSAYNPAVIGDAALWHDKIEHRRSA